MGINELHFFHGFLGSPHDWERVLENLDIAHDVEIFKHDLTSDFMKLGREASFKSWVRLKESEWDPNKKRILVGYSLGGRLAMHLSPDQYEALFLMGAHPGLNEGRGERKKSDFSWFRKLTASSADEWLQDWNAQDVFKNDKNRPSRSFSKEGLQVQVDMMRAWSLATQEDRRGFLLENFQKFFWVCGSRDEKFLNLKQELQEILLRKNVSEIEGSGHGCLFENPKGVAQWISEGMSRVG